MLCTFLLIGCVAISPAATTEVGNRPLNVCLSAVSANQAVAMYAFEKGIYANYGFDVNLVHVEGSSNATAALVAGDMDFCQIGGAAIVNGVVAETDLVLIAGLINTYTYSLMVTSEIESAADLQGKALAASDFGGSSDTAIRAALASLNLRPDDEVAILSIGGTRDRLAAMETGAVVGTVVSVPQTARVRAMGYHELLNMAELNTPFQHTALATTRTLVENERAVVIRFLQATIDAINQMKADKAGVIEVLAQYLLLDVEEDRAELEEGYDKLVLTYFADMPYPTAEGVQVLLDALMTENPAAADFTPDHVIDWSLLDEISEAGFLESIQK